MRTSVVIPEFAKRRGRARPVTGLVRLDRHTRRLAARLAPGEIAVIDHVDLDEVSAQALVAARAAAVLNASPSSSGRYPNQGPRVLLRAGVPLVDGLGDELFHRLRDGDRVSVAGDVVRHNDGVRDGDAVLAHGVRQDRIRVAATMAAAAASAPAQVRSVLASLPDLFDADAALLLRGEGIPTLRLAIDGRPCLVLARGHGHADELDRLRPFLRRYRPVLIGVDGGADVLLAAGLTPHVIVGDLDAVSERALRCGAELVARVSPDNRAYGAARLAALHLPWAGFPASLAAEELGVLLADAHGASLIVTAGFGGPLPTLLDRGSVGSASSMLVQTCLSSRIAPAQAVIAMCRPSVAVRTFVGILGAIAAAIAVAVVMPPVP